MKDKFPVSLTVESLTRGLLLIAVMCQTTLAHSEQNDAVMNPILKYAKAAAAMSRLPRYPTFEIPYELPVVSGETMPDLSRGGTIELEQTPTGPFGDGIPLPIVTPGIPLTLQNFLDCPLGRFVHHPSLLVTTPNGTSRLHWGEDRNGRVTQLPADHFVRDRPPTPVPMTPVDFAPGNSGPGFNPDGDDYQSVPDADSHNCGTSVLCFMAHLFDDCIALSDWRAAAEDALDAQYGNTCHHWAWEVGENPLGGCDIACF